MDRQTIKEQIEEFMWSQYYDDKEMNEVETFLTDTISNCLAHIEGDK